MSVLLNRIVPRPFFAPPDEGGTGGALAGAAAAGDAGGAAAAAAAAAAAGGDKGGDKGGAAAGGGAGGEKPGAGSGTIAGGEKPGAGAAAPVAGKWPENWRQDLAGEDKAYLKTLERYESPAALAKAHREMVARMSSGELKAVSKPPEGATAEQLTAWKKEQGLPEKPEGYIVALKLPDGVVPGEADKPLLDSVAKMAFDKNIPVETVNTFTSWFYQMQDQQMAAREEADQKYHDESLAAVSQEWGKELKVNQNYIANILAVAPDGVADQILTARLPNGRLLGDDPGALKFLVAAAREAFPAASVVPAGTTNAPAAIAGRKAEIETMMGDQRSEYWRGPKSQALQTEYAELLDAESKMKGKAA